MGFFDKLKKNSNEEIQNNKELTATGLDAITREFERIYPGQNDPKNIMEH